MTQTESTFEKRPDFIDFEFTHNKSPYSLSIYIQLLNPQTISGLYYEAEEDFPHRDFLNVIAKNVEMKKIDSLENIVKKESQTYDFNGEVFPIPVMGLIKIINDFTGKNKELDIVSGEENPLICRCFGVGANEINDFLNQNRNCSLIEVTDETMAAGGCGRCQNSIKELIDYYNPKPDPILIGKGISEVQLAKKVQNFLLENKSNLKIKRMIGSNIWVTSNSLNPYNEIDNLQEKFFNTENISVRFSLALSL
ncbi:MAG: (2Fe-2S)-binding protein [Bacteriovoracaceae bacterium]|nr:(2Fe-2S)-binding protein [Bacteriovoracaceae bacterium]